MFIDGRRTSLLAMIALIAAAAFAQQSAPPPQPATGKITLDVVVSTKNGPPVSDLQQQAFTLLDDDAPQTITSFKAVTGRDAPIEVLVVIDAVNDTAQNVSFEREQIEKFLGAEGGHLAYPLAVAIFTDRGTEIVGGSFSSDGNALSAQLHKSEIGLRDIGRSAGFYGAGERLQLSLKALRQLVASEAPRPGRKIVLWVSPGWPLLSGPYTQLDSKQEQQIFTDIVSVSNQLRQANVTLYSVNPIGTGESVGRGSYYEEFLKGVTKPSQAVPGNLGLQVLAIQSGGLAINFANDIDKILQKCLADSTPYYEISFDPPPAKQRDEYHRLEVKLSTHGLVARTRDGYYAQP